MDSDDDFQRRDANHANHDADHDASNNNVLYVPHHLRKQRHSHGGGVAGTHTRIHRRRSSIAVRAALAVEHAARRMSVPAFSINRIEEDLDKEIAEEEKEKQSTNAVQILRRSCKEILHSKKILLLIVVLNIFDCALVLPGLILDIHYIKEMVKDAKILTRKFTSSMIHVFPGCFMHFDAYHLHKFYNVIISGLDNCNQSRTALRNTSYDVTYDVMYTKVHHHELGFTIEDLPAFLTKHHNGHEVEIKLGIIFHKASIAILAILVLIVTLKFVSYGTELLRRKLELFDSLIVIASFTLDLIYLKGFTVYPIEDIVQILAFLLPWRVIRVANSLVMAVMDQAHLQLKMVYNEKKNCEERLNDAEEENNHSQKIIAALKKLCDAEGVSTAKIVTCINNCGSIKKAKRKSKTSLKKKLKTATCLSINDEEEGRKSLPYGHVQALQQDTLHHLRRIASSAKHMSTFEETEEDCESKDDEPEENHSFV